jgi:hypothetical protein
MSADSGWDVQTGVFNALTGTSALTTQLAGAAAGVLDHVPAGTAFPYVVIGEARSVPMDSQDSFGSDVTLTLHTYSRGGGMQEARHIMSAIYDALHDISFAVPNQTLVLCRCLDSETALEADGLTRHGVQRFQVITEPA